MPARSKFISPRTAPVPSLVRASMTLPQPGQPLHHSPQPSPVANLSTCSDHLVRITGQYGRHIQKTGNCTQRITSKRRCQALDVRRVYASSLRCRGSQATRGLRGELHSILHARRCGALRPCCCFSCSIARRLELWKHLLDHTSRVWRGVWTYFSSREGASIQEESFRRSRYGCRFPSAVRALRFVID